MSTTRLRLSISLCQAATGVKKGVAGSKIEPIAVTDASMGRVILALTGSSADL